MEITTKMESLESNKWMCVVCNYISIKCNVRNHVESKHCLPRMYTCQHCGKTLKGLNSYRSHIYKQHKLNPIGVWAYFLPHTLFHFVKAGLPPELVFELLSFLFLINCYALWIFVHYWKPCSGKLLTKPPPTPSFWPPLPLPWLQVDLLSDFSEGDDNDNLRDKASYPSSILPF